MPRRRDRQRECRGTVLVMVVGLLVMLFVMGTSFLFVSRFERQMAEDMAAQSGEDGGGSGGGVGAGDSVAVLNDLLAVVREQLRRDLVGADGIPFNGDLSGDTGTVREDYWDTPGWFDINGNAFPFAVTVVNGFPRDRGDLQPDEVGDGLLASNEPYPDPNNLAYTRPLWTWFAVSSFADNNPRLSHQVVQYPDNDQNNPRSAFYWQLPWWLGTPSFPYPATNFRYDLFHTRPRSLASAGLLPDADGDGYPDFLFATRDRDSDNNQTGATSTPPQEVWPDEEDRQSFVSALDLDQKVALRVISHGGMVLLDRGTPESLLIAATDRNGTGTTQQIIWPSDGEDLDPRVEEVNLRRRNCLPPKADPDDPGGPTDKRTEFERNNNAWLETTDGTNRRRWYPLLYDDAEANGGSTVPDIWDQTYFEDPWMTPPVAGAANLRYDRRHLVTTISYDDLYRPNRDESGIGWRDASNRPFQLGDMYLGNNFMPGLLRRVGGGTGLVAYLPDEGLLPPGADDISLAGRTQFSLADLEEVDQYGVGAVYTKGQQIRLLYAFYRAMLHDTEVPVSLGGSSQGVNRDEQAAMLAVNTWDFFDEDTVPTTVVGLGSVDTHDRIVLNLGLGGAIYDSLSEVVGIEPAFPFLSEVIVQRHWEADDNLNWDLKRTDYALELFNPWPQRLRFSMAQTFTLYVGTSPTTARRLPSFDMNAAVQPGHVNGASANRNLLVIGSSQYAPRDVTFDFNPAPPIQGVFDTIDDDTDNGTVVVLYARNNYTGRMFAIDEIRLDTGGANAPDKLGSDWPVPDDSPDDPPSNPSAGDKHSEDGSLARTQSLQDPQPLPHDTNDWRFHLGIEEDAGPTPQAVNTVTRAAGAFARPVPLYFSNAGEPLGAFPNTGALLLVTRYGHVLRNAGMSHKPMSTLLAEPVPLSSTESPIDRPWRRVDHGHLPVFDQEQYAGIDDDEDDAQIRVPWGQLVFSYFTALPLQRLNLDGGSGDYDAAHDGFNEPSTRPYQYRTAYRNLLQRLTPASMDPNVGLAAPVVERVPTAGEYAYGPRVRGRINLNTAPWSVLDGIPLVQYFTTSEIGPVPEIDLALEDILDLGQDSPIEEDWTIAPTLARAIVAYREARQVLPREADYNGRTEDTSDPCTSNKDRNGDNMIGMRGRNRYVQCPNNKADSLRGGPGFVTVGELANLVHGQAANGYQGGDSAYRVDAFNGLAGGPFDDYTHAIAILASLSDWVTVKSNTYTIYATVVDSTDEVEATRGQWTVDRSRCLYRPDDTRGGLPEIIGPKVIINYADAADDPK